jgi:hypothetical protein
MDSALDDDQPDPIHRSWDDPTVEVTAPSESTFSVTAPADSCYSGATFAFLLQDGVGYTMTHRQCTLLSEIYHPYLHQATPICACLCPTDTDDTGNITDSDWLDLARAQLLALLAHPELFHPCAACTVRAAVWAEMQADLTFFRRKARLHTPSTDPLPDSELRSTLPATSLPDWDLAALLRTGSFSDFKIVASGKKAFRCHRSVLSAVSPALNRHFCQTADGGCLALDYPAEVVARFLRFLYTREFPP